MEDNVSADRVWLKGENKVEDNVSADRVGLNFFLYFVNSLRVLE